MSSATPRTDAAPKWLFSLSGQMQTTCVHVDFARQLERELAQERERLDWLEGRIAILACEPKGTDHEGTWAIGPSGNFQIWAQRCDTARAAIDAAMKEDKP